jgi:hypothetical protein
VSPIGSILVQRVELPMLVEVEGLDATDLGDCGFNSTGL